MRYHVPDELVLEQAGDDIILNNDPVLADSEEHLGRLRIPLRLQSFIDWQKSLGITKNLLGDSLGEGFNLVGDVGTENDTAESLDSPELCLSLALSSSLLESSLSRASPEGFLFITL